jgi:hypothetical protein
MVPVYSQLTSSSKMEESMSGREMEFVLDSRKVLGARAARK